MSPLAWIIPPMAGAMAGFLAGCLAARIIARPSLARRLAGGAIPSMTSILLEKTLADLVPRGPEAVSAKVQKAVASVIRGLISSPLFLHEVREWISGIVSSVWSRPASELLEKINFRAIAEAIAGSLGGRPGNLLSDSVLGSISGLLEQAMPALTERLIEWMKSGEMRGTMAARGRELLPRILDKLNLMQRFLLSAGQFDKRIDEKMPEIVDETLEALERIVRDPIQQSAMRDRMVFAIKDWRDSDSLQAAASPRATDLIEKLLEGLARQDGKEAAGRSTVAAKNVGSLVRQWTGLTDRGISDSLADRFLTWLSGPNSAAALSLQAARWVSGFLSGNRSVQVGGLLGVDERRKQALDSFLIEASMRAAAATAARMHGRTRAMWLAGLSGAAMGLLIGMVEDVLRLLGAA